MANAPQMKIPIGADTQDFDKGARKVKQEMKDLSKVSSDAFDAIGDALGVDTGKLQQFSSAISGLTRSFQKTGAEGKESFQVIASAVSTAAGAIAGLGLGAAIISFKALTSEAENFKNTVAGANIELQTAAYVSTYNQVMHDFASSTGQRVAEVESKWKKFWGTMSTNVKMYFGTGAFREGFNPWGGSTSGTEEYYRLQKKAEDAANESERITGEIYRLERQRKEQAVDLAKLNAQIADAMVIARDASAGSAARQQALLEIESLIDQKKSMTVTLEQRLASLYQQRSDLATDDLAAADATLDQRQRAYDAERAIAEQLASIQRLKNQIAASARASADATREERENIERIRQLRASGDELQAITAGGAIGNAVGVPTQLIAPPQGEIDHFKEVLEFKMGGITFSAGLELDAEKWQETLDNVASSLKSAIASACVSISDAIGQLLGDLATGEDGWGSFANAAISAFGDMAQAVGKIAIEAGTSVIALKAAMDGMSIPAAYMAIAAGMVLVMLGSAVKSGMSNIAAGNYSAGSGVASSASSSSSIGGDYAQRDVYVNVTGTLQADGDQLVAVINNSEKKKRLTT